MRIAFDLDSVIIDSYELMAFHLYNAFGKEFVKEEHHSYNFEVDATPEKLYEEIDNSILLYSDMFPPVEGAARVLNSIYERTHDPLVFITARTSITEDHTRDWIKNNIKLPYVLCMTNNHSKQYYIEKHKITHFVDDRYKTALEISPIVNTMFLFDAPWNRRPISGNIVRINSLDEILTY